MKKLVFIIPFVFIAIFVILYNTRPRPQALENYLIQNNYSVKDNKLKIQFLGNTNILLSDGQTSILTDGFFTRPAVYKVLFGKVEPDLKIINECLHKANIKKLDALIPVHSHYDHALDAAVVADITSAKLIGSRSTINIGKGYGLNDTQMMIPPFDEAIEIGDFSIIFVKSNHWQYPDKKQRELLLNQEIDEPLKTPASIYDYKEGDSYTLLIEHKNTKIAIQGSAGFIEKSINDFDADILLLAIAGLEVMDEDYNTKYQKHIVEALKPEVLIPIHWDDFTVPLSKGLKTTNVLFNFKFGNNLEVAFNILESNNSSQKRKIKILPLWEEISIESLKE